MHYGLLCRAAGDGNSKGRAAANRLPAGSARGCAAARWISSRNGNAPSQALLSFGTPTFETQENRHDEFDCRGRLGRPACAGRESADAANADAANADGTDAADAHA